MTVRPLAEGPEVVTLGEAMALFSAEPGVPLAMATTFRRAVAGAESNVAVGLARLGHRVAWIGRVGADALGRAVLAALRADGLDLSGVRVDEGAPTGVLIRDVHAARRIEVAYHRSGSAGSRLSAADVDPAVVSAARVIYVTGITPLLSPSCHAAVVAAITTAREAGVSVCFDPNLRLRLASAAEARRVLVPLLASADIVLAGDQESEVLSGCRGVEASAAWLLDHGAREVVIKRGEHGAWATDGTDTWEVPAVPVPVVDPVGAGDAFAAGWVSAWLRGLPPQQRLLEAALVAALVVAVAGDTDGLPTWQERDDALVGVREVRR